MPRKETKDVYQIRGYEVIVKKVTPAGTSGKIYLPVDWIGKRVTFYPTAKLMPYPRSRGDNRPPDECIRVFGSPELTSPLTVEFRPPRRKAIRMVLQPVATRRKAAEPAPMTDEEAAEIEAAELAAIAEHDND